MKFASLLAPAVLLTACTTVPPAVVAPPPNPPRPGPMIPWTPEPTGLRFFVEPRVAAPGATVTLVLHNGTAHRAGYNLCSSSLEQLQSGRWVPIPENRVCTRELRLVAPGQQGTIQLRLPTTLASGEYRFRTGVETPLHRETPELGQIYSEAFTVRR